MADPKSSNPPPLPYLFLLRTFCCLQLLVSSFIPPTSSPLFESLNPVQVPLLLFISGFTTTYANAHSHRSGHFDPTLFHVRRFAQLYPLYLLALLLHLAFSSSEKPFARAFFSALGLSPYLPASLAFSSNDSPLPAPNFLPTLFLCYLIFPVLLDVFPRYDTASPHHLSIAFVACWATTIAQAYWLSHLPQTAESSRALMVFDFAVYVPFLAHLTSFVCGMLLALRFLSVKHTHTSVTRRFLFAVISVGLFFVCTAFLLPLRLDIPKDDGSRSFVSNWVLCSALLLPFAALVWTLAALDVPTEGRAKELRLRMEHTTLTHLAAFSYTAYVLAAPVWRSLGVAFCRHKAHKATALKGLMCLPRASVSSVTTVSPWWWPWGHVDFSWGGSVPEAASRVTLETHVLGPGVRPMFFVPVLIAVSAALYVGVQRPLSVIIVSSFERIKQMAENGMIESSLLSRLAVMFPLEGDYAKPRRNNSNAERLLRVLVYYVGGAGFLYFMFRYSRPFTFHVSKPGFWCWIPTAACERIRQVGGGLMADLGFRSSTVTMIVDIIRWLSFLTLPTMLINLFGHIILPRAIWKRLPTVDQILHTNSRADRLRQLESGGLGVSQASIETEPEAENLHSQLLSDQKLFLDFVIYVRYVTRGSNPRLVANNARKAAEVLTECGLPRDMWRVEVVTDNKLGLADQIADLSVYEIVVPNTYKPPNGALYKARALNYAIAASPARAIDWIVHLDEETRFDSDTIRAILYHCGRESYLTRVAKSQRWPRIGQGPILYGRALTDESVSGSDSDSGNWITTLADSGRVSDDCGRYRIQYECGEVWVGMHGSFVVAANCVEQEVTFDHGVEGSIAEDAFFALLARAKDVRFAWIDALMFEQSPFTVADFIKQRSRWLVGGMRVVSSGRIPMRQRLFMKALTYLWALMPLLYSALFLSILFGTGSDELSRDNWSYHHVLLPLLASVSIWNYVFGFFVTFSMRRLGIVRFLTLLYLQLVLTPVFGVLEVAAVSYALLNFERISVGFHVVEKDGRKKARGEDVSERTGLL